MRTAVFGGTFDPPHNAHVEIAERAVASGRVDRVIFVPALDPPHKIGRTLTPYEHRRKMLELALRGRDKLLISDIEMELGARPSYTHATMTALQERLPGDELFILMGGDSLRQLHTWRLAKELAEKWPIIVYPRKNDAPSLAELSAIWGGEKAAAFMTSMLDMPQNEISSSEIRNKMAKNENTDNLMCREVLEHIRENNLYSTGRVR